MDSFSNPYLLGSPYQQQRSIVYPVSQYYMSPELPHTVVGNPSPNQDFRPLSFYPISQKTVVPEPPPADTATKKPRAKRKLMWNETANKNNNEPILATCVPNLEPTKRKNIKLQTKPAKLPEVENGCALKDVFGVDLPPEFL